MEFFTNPHQAKLWCKEQRSNGKRIGLVPTMGALHEGHLSLVKRAADENDICVVSIFVNPLQFNQSEDFASYPRDIETDNNALKNNQCSMVFTGTLESFFPDATSKEEIELLQPGIEGNDLEGAHREGHFAGVKTIVQQLFLTAVPDRAYFGEKDFQQTLVIKQLAEELGFPNIVVCPTHRESNGLAMSSRNIRLSSCHRQQAAIIHTALKNAQSEWNKGVRSVVSLESGMRDILNTVADIDIEYATVRNTNDWNNHHFDKFTMHARALIAVKLGGVRLIDNMALNAPA